MRLEDELAMGITVEEPQFLGLNLTNTEKWHVFSQMRYFYWKLDFVAELAARADLNDDCNIEASILKHLANLDKEGQEKALDEMAELMSDEMDDLKYYNQPILAVFEEYERTHKLMPF